MKPFNHRIILKSIYIYPLTLRLVISTKEKNNKNCTYSLCTYCAYSPMSGKIQCSMQIITVVGCLLWHLIKGWVYSLYLLNTLSTNIPLHTHTHIHVLLSDNLHCFLQSHTYPPEFLLLLIHFLLCPPTLCTSINSSSYFHLFFSLSHTISLCSLL